MVEAAHSEKSHSSAVEAASSRGIDAPETGASDFRGTDSDRGAGSAAHDARDLTDTRPEYVDFDVNDFPGGLSACLEAILMVADQPQHGEDLARILAVEPSDVDDALQRLRKGYEGADGAASHGFTLRHTARGWQYVNRREFESVVSAFVTDGQTARLSQASLEALAIIAYKQPMTRAQVGAIRGVNSDGVVRSLLVRGLIRESGVDEGTRGALLVTTEFFLEKIGLESLEQLPSLAPFLPNVASALESEDS